MGINCISCINGRSIKSEIPVEVSKYTKSIKQIIKIQTIIRGFLSRNSFRKHLLITITPNKINLKPTNKPIYQIISKTSITETQLDYLKKNFSPLNDNIKTEKINLIYPNFAEFSGDWNPKTKEKHGLGIQIWNDKSIYYGQWKNNKLNGKGKLIDPMGDTYEGDFVNDKLEGYGSYIHKKGASYIGNWKNNLQEGKGKEIWPDKTEYEGEYKNGKKWGKGKLILSDGSYYIGDFFNNNIHGNGKFIWSNLNEYNGEWKNNKMDGEGEFKWNDGKIYKGHYFHDQKNGYGELFWPNGKIYKGYWKNGKQNGEGELFDVKENKWKKGFWANGRKVRWEIEK